MRKRKVKEKIVPMVTGEEWHDEFMKRIKHLRETRFGSGRGGKSNAARAIAVTPSDWSGYEKGVMPGADKIYKMCSAFGCDANWLLDVKIDNERKLSEAQEKTISTLINVQQAIHTFDGVFTEALLGMRDILEDPESTQAQSLKLYDIARRLSRLRKECDRQPKLEKITKPSQKKIVKKKPLKRARKR